MVEMHLEPGPEVELAEGASPPDAPVPVVRNEEIPSDTARRVA